MWIFYKFDCKSNLTDVYFLSLVSFRARAWPPPLDDETRDASPLPRYLLWHRFRVESRSECRNESAEIFKTRFKKSTHPLNSEGGVPPQSPFRLFGTMVKSHFGALVSTLWTSSSVVVVTCFECSLFDFCNSENWGDQLDDRITVFVSWLGKKYLKK